LGLGAQSSTVFYRVELKMLSGKAWAVQDD